MYSKTLMVAVVIGLVALATGKLRNHDMLRSVANAVNKQVHKMSSLKDDQGHMMPCNKTDPPFTFTWTPKIIKLGDTISGHFEMVPTVSLSKGKADLTVWLPGYEDPIYQASQDFTCDDISKFIPHICPFKKGVKINQSMKKYIQPDLPLPGGQFKIDARVTNEDGKEFICLTGTIVISNDY